MNKNEKIKRTGEILLQDLRKYRRNRTQSSKFGDPEIAEIYSRSFQNDVEYFNYLLYLENKDYKHTVFNMVLDNYNRHDTLSIFLEDQYAFLLRKWKYWKKIYYIDETLREELSKTENNFISWDILQQLPFNGMYVDTKIKSGNLRSCGAGFLMYHEAKKNITCLEISMFLNCDSIPDQSETIVSPANKNIDVSEKEMPMLLNVTLVLDEDFIRNNNLPSNIIFVKDIDKYIYANYVEQYYSDLINMITEYAGILQYICSASSDVRRSNQSKQTFKSSGDKDKFSEVEELEVGAIIGSTIRKYKSNNANSTTKQDIVDEQEVINEEKLRSSSSLGKKKRAHIRRAHWHTYWVGKRGEQTKTIKWIPPITINCYSDINDERTIISIVK